MNRKFYITTAIAYTNAKPHIGFAMELIQADALARYHRAKGDDVYFLTGTDEHGVKMYQTAKEQEIETQSLVDQNAKAFVDLAKTLNISYNDFIRTSSERHKKGAQKLWKALEAAGDIYQGTYHGFYCVGCEAYVTEKDLVDGKCQNHGKEPVRLEEKNYFFRYAKYLPIIKEAIEKDELLILPVSRKHEMLNLIERAATEEKDVSFSRPTEALPWGVSVPSDPTQTMYVWCDALANYITALDYENNGKLFQQYWPAEVHLIGKDILRFHAGYWIAMLLSAKIALPKAIYVHGYITSNGKKMSKTLGNVIDPFEIAKQYGVDPLRYYLLREIPTTEDGDFSKSKFETLYNTELANNLGNLLSRVLTLVEKYGVDEKKVDSRLHEAVPPLLKTYEEGMTEFNIKASIEAILELVDLGNKYVEEKKPWELAKKNHEELKIVLKSLLELLWVIGELFSPIMPETSEKILTQLKSKKKGLALFPRISYAGASSASGDGTGKSPG